MHVHSREFSDDGQHDHASNTAVIERRARSAQAKMYRNQQVADKEEQATIEGQRIGAFHFRKRNDTGSGQPGRRSDVRGDLSTTENPGIPG